MAVTRRDVVILALMLILAVPVISQACPFCTQGGKTLTQEVNQATLVLYGKLSNANENAETTDIDIEDVIKDDPAVRGKKMKLTLSRFVDLSVATDKDRFLVFCDLFNGKIDPYRGMALQKGSKLPEYIRGALKVKDKETPDRLRFFFGYLDSDDLEISNDAYREFANCDYKDFKAMAKDLPADKVARWLADNETPSYRYGLYASMLGHCGKEKHADTLRSLLDDPDRRVGSGIDGVLAAYTLLKPKEGWKYLQESLKNTKEEFTFRYAALRAVRFLYEYRSDVVNKSELETAVCALLDQEDIADLAIEDLRKWQCWDKIDKVLAVRKTEAYKLPIVQRALLRYCLQCPGKPAATNYVAERRKADAEAVDEAVELLKLEQEATPKKVIDKAKKEDK
jgi:hypothetical protein